MDESESSSSAIGKSSFMSDRSSDYPKSDQLSVPTKLEIKRLPGDTCWACNSLSPQIAHVVGKEDQQVNLWHDAGLLDFQLNSAANDVFLCYNYHLQFDRAQDPGFVFIPTDLQYFIDFEVKDRKRVSAAREGYSLPREVPANVMYKDHLVEQGITRMKRLVAFTGEFS
ncbi:hypothetical protein DPV78_010590 [Talaromyces pinophilus]|nr:hypothetical protein DPV78_010590 [Talaromyces pinophilus]